VDKSTRTAVIATYALGLFLLIINILLSSIKVSNKVARPTSNSYSVLSLTNKNLRNDYIIYGFLPYWSLEKTHHFQLDKLTDIAYFALEIDKDGHIRTYNDEGYIEPGYNNWRNSEKLTNLINEAEKYGIRLSLTIISHDDAITEAFLNCRDCWNAFFANLTSELEFRNIYNVNLDFESIDLADQNNRKKYSEFINFINIELDKKYADSFVTVSTLPDSMTKPKLTDIESLSRYADAIFIMAYDFHRPTSETAGPIAPINGAEKNREYDVTTMLKDYLSVSPPNKLILGVPYYGYNWKVANSSPKSDRIPGDEETGFSISQTYKDVMEVIFKYNPVTNWDSTSQSPYFSYINEEKGYVQRQVYYENKDSIRAKYILAKQNNLAGVGIWALGYDGGYQELWDLLEEEFPN